MATGPGGPVSVFPPEDAGLVERWTSILEVQLRCQLGDAILLGWAPSLRIPSTP